MWTQDVGRFEGANYGASFLFVSVIFPSSFGRHCFYGFLGLLKIVFEMNLRLFRNGGQKNKTLIYFIFRDHNAEETPLAKISTTIRTDMGTHHDPLLVSLDWFASP